MVARPLLRQRTRHGPLTMLPRGSVSRSSWGSLEKRMIGPESAIPDEWVRFAQRHKNAGPSPLGQLGRRHAEVAETMVRCLSCPTDMRHFSAAASCCADVRAQGHNTPDWEDLPTALLRALAALVTCVLAILENRWQHDPSLLLEQRFVDVVVPRASRTQRAMLRSQGGPLTGLPFTTLPLTPLHRSESHLFSVLLMRRLHLPLPLSSRFCRSERPLDCLGHHRASCSRAGVLGRRGFALESAVARVCREAGARVSADVFLQGRIVVIADGLLVFHGAQLAIDATLVSPLRADGEPHSDFRPSAQGAHVSRAHRWQRSCQTRRGCG